ncbi:MAG: IclR family transcriptional regulator [Spirochaetes bacterium]|nr:IclR family transcriptional regulator [Spirochaetota bacterium]
MAGTTIQSLTRGLQILEILGKTDHPLSLNEITDHFSIDRSSVFRLIATLIQGDFVRQDSETKRYSLGYKVMELAGAYGEQSQIESIIRPIMQRVCLETRQNTHLAVLDGGEVVFIAVEQPRDSLTMHISVGTREPAWVTALGKALLSGTNPSKLRGILESSAMHRFSEKTVTDIDSLMRQIDDAGRELSALDLEEYKPGILCIAAPVFNHRGDVQYSLGISGARELILPDLQSMRDTVRSAAIEASMKLGYAPKAQAAAGG